MARRDTARRIAGAISQHAKEQSANAQTAVQALVTRVEPYLLLETSRGVQLDEDDGDFVLSQWSDAYHSQVGIEVGDTVILDEQPNQTWLTVMDVVSDSDVSALFAGSGGGGGVGATGATGPAGAAGATGATGAGATGATGATGPSGSVGATGSAGFTVRNGAGAPSAGLGENDDFYIDTTAHAIYGPKTGGSWGSPTSLVGATGPTGAVGATGVGATGATGVVGAIGPTGIGGYSILNGVSVPSSGLGINGDFYIDTAANTIYGPKAAGAWGSATLLIGPTGATGVAGYSVLNGAGAPSAGTGVNGDFYLDTTAQAIYGPKTAGAWGSGTILIGATGATGVGATGATGAASTVAGATGPPGPSGPTGSTGAASTVPGPTGATGAVGAIAAEARIIFLS